MALSNPLEYSQTSPIGLYDSGVGGLSVLDSLLNALPKEHYCYFGDTLNMPYGNKSQNELRALVEHMLHWLCQDKKVKLVAVACNTTAGVLADELPSLCPVPLIDPISPLCDYLSQNKPYKKVGILATPKTVESKRYVNLIEGATETVQTKQIPCDGLATLVEQGKSNTPECLSLFLGYAQPLLDWGAEALILGCTHYPHLIPYVQPHLPQQTALLDPALWMGDAVKKELEKHHLLQSDLTVPQHIEISVSGQASEFIETGKSLPLSHPMPWDKVYSEVLHQHPQAQSQTVLNS